MKRRIILVLIILIWILASISGYFFIFNKMHKHLAQTENVLDKDVPLDLWEKIKSNKSESKLDYLKYIYDEIGNKYTSRPRYYLREPFNKFFETNVSEIWEGTPDRPSTIQNYMLKLILIKSGRFIESDIVIINTYCVITPHQYLKVRLDKEWVNVDLWDREKPHEFGELTC